MLHVYMKSLIRKLDASWHQQREVDSPYIIVLPGPPHRVGDRLGNAQGAHRTKEDGRPGSSAGTSPSTQIKGGGPGVASWGVEWSLPPQPQQPSAVCGGTRPAPRATSQTQGPGSQTVKGKPWKRCSIFPVKENWGYWEKTPQIVIKSGILTVIQRGKVFGQFGLCAICARCVHFAIYPELTFVDYFIKLSWKSTRNLEQKCRCWIKWN